MCYLSIYFMSFRPLHMLTNILSLLTSIPILIVCWKPLQSIVISGISLFNSDLIFSIACSSESPLLTLITLKAPISLATFNRYSVRSVIITFEAPMAFAVANVTKPIGPAPKIRTVEPTFTLPFLHA